MMLPVGSLKNACLPAPSTVGLADDLEAAARQLLEHRVEVVDLEREVLERLGRGARLHVELLRAHLEPETGEAEVRPFELVEAEGLAVEVRATSMSSNIRLTWWIPTGFTATSGGASP